MLITGIVFTVIFVLAGIMLLRGKWAFLIAGYNTMSKKEKKRYDEKALCRFTGKIMLGFALGSVLFILGGIFNNDILDGIGFSIIIVLAVFMVVYMNTGNRFKK